MSPQTLYNKVRVCSLHFIDSDYRSTTKKFLKETAVPKPFLSVKKMASTLKEKIHCRYNININFIDNIVSLKSFLVFKFYFYLAHLLLNMKSPNPAFIFPT